MRNPYFHAGGGLFLEATDSGGVEVIVKSPARLSGRTVVRMPVTLETLEAGVKRMKELLVKVNIDHGGLGPRVTDEQESIHVFHAGPDDAAPDFAETDNN